MVSPQETHLDNVSSISLVTGGDVEYLILAFGPRDMKDDLVDILQNNRISARICFGENLEEIKYFLGKQEFDVYVYHASFEHIFGHTNVHGFVGNAKKESYQDPRLIKADLLGYGVSGSYSQEIIDSCKEEFAKELKNKLEQSFQ